MIVVVDTHVFKTSVKKLIDERTTLMLAEFDAETRFQLRAARGAGQQARGLDLLRNAQDSGATT